MSVHQYIGARYVPYYYQNSLDPTSTEWEPNVTYEALTVVTLPNQHSYISKKAVPDTIGSPALNAEYWLDQGTRDAYINSLQSQIDVINNTDLPAIDGRLDTVEGQINTINNTDLPALDGRLDTLEEWVDVMGIIRKNDDNSWSVLNDGAHESKYIDHCEIDNNGRLNIIFDRTFSKIGSGVLTPDESYCKAKMTAGCSIQTNKAIIEFTSGTYSGMFKFNGNTPTKYGTLLDGDIKQVAWESVQQGFQITFNDYCQTNTVTGIALTLLKNGNAPTDTGLVFSARSVGGAHPGDIQIIPNKDLSAASLTGAMYVTVNHAGEVFANDIPYDAYSNWWFHAKMKL